MTYVSGAGLDGAPIDVKDPLADRLRALAGEADPVAALLGLREVFPEALARDPRFVEAVTAAHRTLREQGAARAAMAVAG
jgi:fructuronate reductase